MQTNENFVGGWHGVVRENVRRGLNNLFESKKWEDGCHKPRNTSWKSHRKAQCRAVEGKVKIVIELEDS
jgi:hypothetical protein